MKIELRKKEDLSGKIFYFLWVDDTCEAAGTEYMEMQAKYNEYLSRAREGYPKETVLKSVTIS